jgi:hypothetical protein
MKNLILLFVALLAQGCSVNGSAQLNAPHSGKVEGSVRDVNPNDLGQSASSLELGNMRLRPAACEGTNIAPEYAPLTADSFLQHLKSVNLAFEVEQAREDLIYVDIQQNGSKSRFRVATLPSAPEAARHLHEALLQHGQGSWGVHRANLAILGPIGSVESIVDFAVASKLACWGVLTIAGRDDAFVVAGGYEEL